MQITIYNLRFKKKYSLGVLSVGFMRKSIFSDRFFKGALLIFYHKSNLSHAETELETH